MNTRKHIVAALMLVVAVAAAVLVGCKKEKLEYSCNPEINKWAKKNHSLFSSAERRQLALLPLELQQAAFRTLSPSKKFFLWREKMAIIRDDWDEPVQYMIDDLLSEFDSSWYVSKTDLEKHSCFIKKWEDEMLKHHMDSVDYVINFVLLATPNEIDVYLNDADDIDYSWISFPNGYSKDAPGGSQSSQPKCMCSYDISCSAYGNGTCSNTDCLHTVGGCGLLGLFDCKKDCTYKTNVVE